LLFDNGAEIDIVNHENQTPVDYASNEVKKTYNLESKLQMKKWDKHSNK